MFNQNVYTSFYVHLIYMCSGKPVMFGLLSSYPFMGKSDSLHPSKLSVNPPSPLPDPGAFRATSVKKSREPSPRDEFGNFFFKSFIVIQIIGATFFSA